MVWFSLVVLDVSFGFELVAHGQGGRDAPGSASHIPLHPLGRNLEFVVHNFPFVLVSVGSQMPVVVNPLALDRPKFTPETFCPLRAAMGAGLAVVCVQPVRDTRRARYVAEPRSLSC